MVVSNIGKAMNKKMTADQIYIPGEIEMRTVCFVDGGGGRAEHHYRCDKYGISMVNRIRNYKSKKERFVEDWGIDLLPEKRFESFGELRKTVNEL